ncbi:MAG: hypothetical protein MJZ00_05135 [Paludibacteraceae bacterium]|nr:hypothetical protein [Paludibacteraceae bacterium]
MKEDNIKNTSCTASDNIGDRLSQALRLINEIPNSGFIPFSAGSNASSTEVKLRNAITFAINELSEANLLYEHLYKR